MGTRKHTIKWEVICKPKRKGGLGIQVMAWKNAAILAKWWREGRIDKTKLGHRFLTTKYGENLLSNPKGGGKHISPMINHISSVREFSQIKLFNLRDFVT